MCMYLYMPKKSEFYLENFGGESLYVYTLTTTIQKKNKKKKIILENNSIHNDITNNKYLLTKEAKDLYPENHKTLMKETQDTNKWKIFHAHELEEVINVHTAQSNLAIQCNPYQNSNDIFHIEKNP